LSAAESCEIDTYPAILSKEPGTEESPEHTSSDRAHPKLGVVLACTDDPIVITVGQTAEPETSHRRTEDAPDDTTDQRWLVPSAHIQPCDVGKWIGEPSGIDLEFEQAALESLVHADSRFSGRLG
jgi:hypothetical protein